MILRTLSLVILQAQLPQLFTMQALSGYNDATDKSAYSYLPTMEAVFLVQPWVQARTAMDCCKLCFQERESKEHLECKRAHLAAYNSLLAVLKLERGSEFENALKSLEEAKSKCLANAKPDSQCHAKSQEALKQTLAIYDRILDDYRKRLPTRTAPRL